MASIPIVFLTVLSALPGAVILTQHEGRIDVVIDDQPFTSLYYGPNAPKPYLHPVRAASGKIVTRRFPMDPSPGETKDRHHRGLWFGYKDINGFNFWENEFSYKDPKAGKVITKSVNWSAPATIKGVFEWLSPQGKALLEESRTMTFGGIAPMREIDVDVSFRALVRATFGDSKDGFFAIRLNSALSEAETGTITNSSGGRSMKETWGKRAEWVDYSGQMDGEKLGVTVIEDPRSFQFPPRWHVRDYGLLASNPFGVHAFDAAEPVSPVTLEPGQTIRLRYRVVIHGAQLPDGISLPPGPR